MRLTTIGTRSGVGVAGGAMTSVLVILRYVAVQAKKGRSMCDTVVYLTETKTSPGSEILVASTSTSNNPTKCSDG